MASIMIVSGPAEGRYYGLGHRTVVVGRHEACGIQIVDELISSRHMELRADAEDHSYHAVDLHSTNGVRINEQLVTADTRLMDGDVIDIGNSRLVFSVQEFPDKESAFAHLKLPGEGFRRTMIE